MLRSLWCIWGYHTAQGRVRKLENALVISEGLMKIWKRHNICSDDLKEEEHGKIVSVTEAEEKI